MAKTGTYKDKDYMKKWREANKDRINTSLRKWRKQNRQKVKESNLKYFYGITLDDYNEMFEKQEGLCGICKEKDRKLCVDHCHETGMIRGLLCPPCNMALGALGDNLKGLQKAANYLRKEYG